MPKQTFAEWLKAERLARGLSQLEAAAFLKMGRSKYIELEHGPTKKRGRAPAYSEEHGLRPLVLAMPKK